MRGRSGSPTWQRVFAAGIVLRPILIVPMAPSGPLGGSPLLPIGLAVVFAFSILVGAGVFVGNRLALAFAVLTAFAGIPIAAAGVAAGLPMPWTSVLGGYNVALTAVGVAAWRELQAAKDR